MVARIDPGAHAGTIARGGLALSIGARGDCAAEPIALGRDLFAFHGRIDGRRDLGRALGLSDAALCDLDDAALAARAWNAFGNQIVDRMAGDYAFAHWQEDGEALTLVRGPLSTRPLFFCAQGARAAFATAPQGLTHLPWVGARPDLETCARILSRARYDEDDRTVFRGIRRVRPGHAVRIGSDVQVRRLWTPRLVAVPGSLEAIGEALRFELDRAVADRLAGVGAVAACQLSGGRDSSAVFASAARQHDADLVAITGAPLPGFSERAHGLPCDEAELASTIAARHPGARHTIVRPGPIRSAGDYFAPLQKASVSPLLTPTNAPWWMATIDTARAQGAGVLLTGEMGNFSISNGGGDAIDRFWREGAPGAYVRHGRALAGWRGLTLAILATILPRSGYGAVRALAGKPPPRCAIPVLNPPWRAMAEAHCREDRDPRPVVDFRAETVRDLLAADQGDPFTLIGWGVDIRDPTADRRLVEFCLSLPARALTGMDGELPAYEAAFGSRLPRPVLRPEQRAYQQLDWFELFDPEDLRGLFRALHAHAAVAELLDLDAIERLLDHWPRDTQWMRDPARFAAISDQYRNQLFLALSVAHFLVLHCP